MLRDPQPMFISLGPGLQCYDAQQILPNTRPAHLWRIFHVELPKGDWQTIKIEPTITCGEYKLSCIEGFVHGASKQRLTEDVKHETGITPDWLRYFEEDDNNILVYIFGT